MTKVQVIAKDIPRNVMKALTNDARKRDVTVRVVAVEALERHFGLDVTNGRRRTFTPPPSNDLNLEVQPELLELMRERVFRERGTIRGVIVAVLAATYKLPVPTSARRPRRG